MKHVEQYASKRNSNNLQREKVSKNMIISIEFFSSNITWTRIAIVNPRTNQMIWWSFMNWTSFSLHPVFVASLMVHPFSVSFSSTSLFNSAGQFFGQHASGNFLLCPYIGSQSVGWFTPQHLYCKKARITIFVYRFSIDENKPHAAEFPTLSVALFAPLQRKESR